MGAVDSPHDYVMSSRVVGKPVYNLAGDKIGLVEDLSIEKVSGRTVFALLGIGGFLGIGERLHPLPWAILEYDPEREGFVVPLEKEVLKNAPSLGPDDLAQLGSGGTMHTRLVDYYEPHRKGEPATF